MDAKTKTPKIACRNWECGVVVVVPVGSSTQLLAPSLTWTTASSLSTVHADADADGKGKDHEQHEGGKVDEQQQKQRQPSIPGIEVFQNIVPVPFQIPAAPLDGDAGDAGQDTAGGGPWFFMD